MTVTKAIVQVVMAVLAAIVPALTEPGPMTLENIVNVIVLGAGAIMVYNTANIPGWPYAKMIASAISAVAVLLVSAWQGGLAVAEVIQMALAALAAIGVASLPNGTRHADLA